MAIYYLKKELQGEYLEAYEQIELYADAGNFGGDARDELLMNLLDLLTTAQADGKPVENVVGKDLQQFCGDYFSEYGTKEKIQAELKNTYHCMWFVLFLEGFDLLIQVGEGISIWKATTDISGYLIGLAFGWVIVMIDRLLVQPHVFRMKKIWRNVYNIGLVVIVLGGIVILAGWAAKYEIKLLALPVVLLAVIYIFIYRLITGMRRYRMTGRFHKERNLAKEAEKEAENREYRKMYLDTYVKVYDKKNQKLLKKGKNSITPQEYMDKLYKEREQAKIVDRLAAIIVAVLMIASVIWVAQDSTQMDTVIYALIMAGSYILYFKVIRHIFSSEEWYGLLDECKEKGITIFDYKETN